MIVKAKRKIKFIPKAGLRAYLDSTEYMLCHGGRPIMEQNHESAEWDQNDKTIGLSLFGP